MATHTVTMTTEADIRAVGIDGIILRGAHIRHLREMAHLSVRDLAKRLGYTRSAIYDWESERHACPYEMYEPLLTVLAAAQDEYAQRQSLLRSLLPHHLIPHRD